MCFLLIIRYWKLKLRNKLILHLHPPRDFLTNISQTLGEHCNAMILRGGKQLEGSKGEVMMCLCMMHVVNDEDEVPIPSNEVIIHVHNSKEPPKDSNITFPKPYNPPLPFPQRMVEDKLDLEFGKFLKVHKKLCINIPFAETLSQVHSYAKFLKEILSNKRKLEEHETVALTEECSVAIQNMLPAKIKDPVSFSIPCLIGNVSINHALCDLGSSVSFMPLSLCEKLELGEKRPTTISLQLVERSLKYSVGVLEDANQNERFVCASRFCDFRNGGRYAHPYHPR